MWDLLGLTFDSFTEKRPTVSGNRDHALPPPPDLIVSISPQNKGSGYPGVTRHPKQMVLILVIV